jgi:hypothetical protein
MLVLACTRLWWQPTTSLSVRPTLLSTRPSPSSPAASAAGQAVDLEACFSQLTLDVIGKAVFNYDFDAMNKDTPVIQVGAGGRPLWQTHFIQAGHTSAQLLRRRRRLMQMIQKCWLILRGGWLILPNNQAAISGRGRACLK